MVKSKQINTSRTDCRHEESLGEFVSQETVEFHNESWQTSILSIRCSFHSSVRLQRLLSALCETQGREHLKYTAGSMWCQRVLVGSKVVQLVVRFPSRSGSLTIQPVAGLSPWQARQVAVQILPLLWRLAQTLYGCWFNSGKWLESIFHSNEDRH